MTKKQVQFQLARAGLEQVGSTHHIGYAGLCIVHCGGEVKGIHPAPEMETEIAILAREVAPLRPEQAVLELDAHSLYHQTECACAPTGGQPLAAKARIDC